MNYVSDIIKSFRKTQNDFAEAAKIFRTNKFNVAPNVRSGMYKNVIVLIQ